jgi:hypothetical protein
MRILNYQMSAIKVCQWLATGQWFYPGPPVSSTNNTDHHDITEILLKMALNTIREIVFACTITATTAPYCNGFFMRILNNQMSAINYVLLSNDICKGVKRVIIDKGGFHWRCEFESQSGLGVKHYVIKFVNDLQQVNDFIRVFRFPPPITLTTTI